MVFFCAEHRMALTKIDLNGPCNLLYRNQSQFYSGITALRPHIPAHPRCKNLGQSLNKEINSMGTFTGFFIPSLTPITSLRGQMQIKAGKITSLV